VDTDCATKTTPPSGQSTKEHAQPGGVVSSSDHAGNDNDSGGSTVVVVVVVVLSLAVMAAIANMAMRLRRQKVGAAFMTAGSELDDGIAVGRFDHFGSSVGAPPPLQPWETPIITMDNPVSALGGVSSSSTRFGSGTGGRFGSGSVGRFGSGSGGRFGSGSAKTVPDALRRSLVNDGTGFVEDDVEDAL